MYCAMPPRLRRPRGDPGGSGCRLGRGGLAPRVTRLGRYDARRRLAIGRDLGVELPVRPAHVHDVAAQIRPDRARLDLDGVAALALRVVVLPEPEPPIDDDGVPFVQ